MCTYGDQLLHHRLPHHGIQFVGNHYLWTERMKLLGLSIPVQTKLYLLDLDKQKLRNFCQEHYFANMAKRKKNKHEKIQVHINKANKYQARNALYSSRTGCDDTTKGQKQAGEKSGDKHVYVLQIWLSWY